MQFLFSEFAGLGTLEITGDGLAHLRARRVREGERIDVRNLRDGTNYLYEISALSKRAATLNLVFKSSVIISGASDFSVAWAVCESATIEKCLPQLNEMGVKCLNLVFCEYSQRDTRLNSERFSKIITASCEQCGRDVPLEICIFKDLAELLATHPNIARVDFGGDSFDAFDARFMPLIGPEGGFSEAERALIAKSYRLNTPNILRSSTAVVAVCAKLGI